MSESGKTIERWRRERLRLLRYLEYHVAHLEWPSGNQVLHDLVDRGEVALGEESIERWGGKSHAMRALRITEAGRHACARKSEPTPND